jgi:manganese transport protein
MNPEVILIHIVESAVGHFFSGEAFDEEIKADTHYLEKLANKFALSGTKIKVRIGAGNPAREILKIAHEERLNFLVMGSHGHKLINDLLYGSTIPDVRHNVGIPVLTIPVRQK